jgi:FkbM family methyltransferase
MPIVGKTGFFAELGPEQTARDLFGHLKPGSKVAIVSRFSKEHTQLYIDALERRGLQVRFVTGQSGVQDFCFLVSAQKEIVGPAGSTYFVWASYLSNSTQIIAYSLDFKEQPQEQDNLPVFQSYNFSNSGLKSRFKFRLIKREEPPMSTASSSTSTSRPSSEHNSSSSSTPISLRVDCSTISRDTDQHLWFHNFSDFAAVVDRPWWSGRHAEYHVNAEEVNAPGFFQILLNSSRDEIFVDVGANVGQMALVGMVANFSTWAFDPLEYDIMKICEGVHQNVERGFIAPTQSQRLHLFQLLVGNETLDAVNISRPNANFGKFEQASLAATTIGVVNKPKLEIETVPMVKLDDIIPKDAQIGVVKIDVQGVEMMVVQGMHEILSRTSGYPHTIFYEEQRRVTVGAGYQMGAVQKVLEGYGYTCQYDGDGNDIVCKKPRK